MTRRLTQPIVVTRDAGHPGGGDQTVGGPLWPPNMAPYRRSLCLPKTTGNAPVGAGLVPAQNDPARTAVTGGRFCVRPAPARQTAFADRPSRRDALPVARRFIAGTGGNRKSFDPSRRDGMKCGIGKKPGHGLSRRRTRVPHPASRVPNPEQPGTKHQAPRTRNQEPSTTNQARGAKNKEPRTKNKAPVLSPRSVCCPLPSANSRVLTVGRQLSTSVEALVRTDRQPRGCPSDRAGVESSWLAIRSSCACPVPSGSRYRQRCYMRLA